MRSQCIKLTGIGRMFAIPKMKKHSHRIIPAADDALIVNFPAQAGKISSVAYWTPGAEGIKGFLK